MGKHWNYVEIDFYAYIVMYAYVYLFVYVRAHMYTFTPLTINNNCYTS